MSPASRTRRILEIPFTVPAGQHRVSVDFQYTGKEQRATLDLGVADPERFRGQSGGNKSHFTISETDATPSYLPGAIPPGMWRFLISVPNMRAQTVSHYRAEIRFNARGRRCRLRGATSGYRNTLVSRRVAHAHCHSDGQLLEPERQDGSLPGLSRRADGLGARTGLPCQLPTITLTPNMTRSASYSLTLTVCC